jgi:hypothetical protein
MEKKMISDEGQMRAACVVNSSAEAFATAIVQLDLSLNANISRLEEIILRFEANIDKWILHDNLFR